MRLTNRILLTAALATTSTSIFAASAPTGTFIGARIGGAQYQSPKSNLPGTTNGTNSRKALAWGLSIGYNYANTPNRYAGIQLDFNHYGKAKYKGTLSGTTKTASIQQYDIAMLFTLGLVSQAGLNAAVKVGVARITQEVANANFFGSSAFKFGNQDKTRYRPKAELQIGFMPSDYLNLSILLTHTFGQNYSNWPVNSKNAISSSAVYLNADYTIPQ